MIFSVYFLLEDMRVPHTISTVVVRRREVGTLTATPEAESLLPAKLPSNEVVSRVI